MASEGYDQLVVSSALERFNSMDNDAHLRALLSSHGGNLFNRLSSELTQLQHHGKGYEQMSTDLVNSSIYDQELHLDDVLQSRRLSLGIGSSDHFPSMKFDTKECNKHFGTDMNTQSSLFRSIHKRGPCDSMDDIERPASQKRRLSNLVLGPSFFDDYSKADRRNSIASRRFSVASRRSSCASAASFHSVGMTEPANIANEEGQDDASILAEAENAAVDTYQTLLTQNSRAVSSDINPIRSCSTVWHCTLNAAEVKELMEAFTDAMGESQKSQQAIHDWDRKMGLKRSHSKTMRLSMRSRKKLKIMVRKDLPAMTKKN